MSLAPGQILDGKYRIVRVLGVGGMGAVYEGENTRIHRRVAIKVLHAEVAKKAEIVQRFEREAQAAGRIGSEHIVEVLDLGNLPSGERYMVMEFLDGVSLTDRIKQQGHLPPEILGPLLAQLLAGLGAAHEAGIVHRDLKPDNVFLVRRASGDFVKLLDFGVSKFSALGDDFSMTKTGAVMGTPYYMSPEQARGQPIDPRSDLYSVGVVAYQALTGRVPFQAETFNELLFKIALETPPALETVVPGMDPGFAGIVRRAMEREPAARFQSAAEFFQAVSSWLASRTGVGLPAVGPIATTGPSPSGGMGIGAGSALGVTPSPLQQSQGPVVVPPAGVSTSKAPVIAAVALSVVLGIGVAVVLARSSSEPPVESSDATDAAARPAPTASVSVTAPSAAPTAAAAASAGDAAAAPSATPSASASTSPSAAPSSPALQPTAPLGAPQSRPNPAPTAQPTAATPTTKPSTGSGRAIGSDL
jgi:tRNA A-37 threonylcarbamoyl transferase component Bud32